MPHPKYDDMTTDNDFNLVFLSRPVSAKNLKLVTLNSEDDMPAVGDSVHVSGWGDTAKEDDIQTLSNGLMVSRGICRQILDIPLSFGGINKNLLLTHPCVSISHFMSSFAILDCRT